MKRHSPVISHRDSVLLRRIALFRYELRRFLRFSERTSRLCGITPQQHQLLLGVAGFTPDGSANISELAEFFQERHNAVVGLVERAVKRGLVRKERSSMDQRIVRVSLTPSGAKVLVKIARENLRELARVKAKLPRGFKLPPPAPKAKKRN
ncbi:MAG TPA: MarR family transcriptional regulator [Terriglobia bacterium]|nr:MarR family transcriptional regulator [Terriglobia bacterium]